MDDFLLRLYDEDMQKTSSVFDSMSVSELQQFIGVKLAGDLSQQQRENLPSKDFAVTKSLAAKKKGIGDVEDDSKGRYPIPDKSHAQNALARVSQNGTPAEKAAVRAKVYSKYPELRESHAERTGEDPMPKTSSADVVMPSGVKGHELNDHSVTRLKRGLKVQKQVERDADSDAEKLAWADDMGRFLAHLLGGSA